MSSNGLKKGSKMQRYDLCPNLKIAQKFLDFLDPGGSFTFQLFDDDHSKRDRRLAVMLHGTLKDHWNEICRLQKQGAGVYVTVNQTDLKGRKKENITRVRSVYVDLDDAPIDPVLEHELEPHCIVESSENKWHAYWRCDIDKEDFTALQKTLIKAFGGDKSVNDLPRVLRLPGCYHLKSKDGSKAEPFMTRIEQLVDGIKPYRKHDFEKYFEIADEEASHGDGILRDHEQPSEATIIEVLSRLKPDDREEWVKVAHALKATNDSFLTYFLSFSEGEYIGQTPSNFKGREDVIRFWSSLKPNRTNFGALVNIAKSRGYSTQTTKSGLTIGSQLEIANAVLPILKEVYSDLVYDEGSIWGFNRTHWHRIEHQEIRRYVYKFDGVKVQKSRLRLSKNFIDGVMNELTIILGIPGFFADAVPGVNMKNGFVQITADGSVHMTEHDPELRQRVFLDYKYTPRLTVSYSGLLARLFDGCFGSDAEELGELIMQIYGVAICGISTRLKDPKAFILFGQSAANGKSTIQKILRNMLPKEVVCSISPADVDKEQYLAKFVGRVANLSDELSGASAISSDKFKALITGDPVTAKIIYKEPFDFVPKAIHILSTNVLPNFRGGVDAGIQRRLLVVPFNRTIPVEHRLSDLDVKLMREQGDLIISEAIRSAAEVYKNGFYTIPRQCEETTQDWLKEADPVLNWLEDGGLMRAVPAHISVLLREIYIYFSKDMQEIGVKYIPGVTRFNAQLRSYIADDPSWEEVRHADGKKIQRSSLVSKIVPR